MEKQNKSHRFPAFLTILAALLLLAVGEANGDTPTTTTQSLDSMVSCLKNAGIKNFTTMVGTQTYERILNFSLQNTRYEEPEKRQPGVIILPENTHEVSKSVQCSVQNGFQIRVRGGGHSYEGISYTAPASRGQRFAMLDLMRMDAVTINVSNATAWVDGGATLGQLYSAIADASDELAYPAGTCPTVGAGGHIAGGGIGFLARAYGLAGDHVVDAELVDGSGVVLKRGQMGDDVFWALHGGGGGNWGVVTKWQLRLVHVPARVTAYNVVRTGRSNLTDAVAAFQRSIPKAERKFFMRVQFFGIVRGDGKRDMRASFQGLFLGSKQRLLQRMAKLLPELKMSADECKEMRWVESVALFSGTPRLSVDELTDRYYINKTRFKIKSDIVPLGHELNSQNLTGLWDILEEEPSAYMIFSAFGGAMADIPANFTPFPHRAGNAFDVQYKVVWNESSRDDYYLQWMRKLYAYMTPFASQNPRAGYVNYLDLDLGSSPNETQTVEEARKWGFRYFLHNYDRLVKAKTEVDPGNVFKNPQSIPPAAAAS